MATSKVIHSYSSINTYLKCRYKYYLAKKWKVASPPSLGQLRGSAGHAAMAKWYETHDFDQAIEAAHQSYVSGEIEGNQEDWDLLNDVLIRSIEWCETNESDFKLIDTELKFDLDIEGHLLTGYIDGVVEWQGQVWLLEHKFMKQAQTSHLGLDPQVSVYMLAATLLGLKPVGVLYQIFRVSNGPTAKREPVVRVPLYRSTDGLAYFAEELIKVMSEIEEFMADTNLTNVPPRSMSRDCSWCSYNQICMEINDSGDASHLIRKGMR